MTFEDAVRCYADTVYRVALNICRNTSDSEDVMQNVFMRFLKKCNKFSSQEHIKAWLIRVTINESKRLLKSNARCECESLEDIQNEVFARDEDKGELLAQVMELSEKYRTVLYLYYYEGYSLKEIAHILKLNEATVRTQLSRARERLRIKLTEEDDD